MTPFCKSSNLFSILFWLSHLILEKQMMSPWSISILLGNSWSWQQFNPLDFMKLTALMMIYMTLSIFKAFARKFSWCLMKWYFIRPELLVVNASSSINFISTSVLPVIFRAPSVAIPGMTMVKENCSHVFFLINPQSTAQKLSGFTCEGHTKVHEHQSFLLKMK